MGDRKEKKKLGESPGQVLNCQLSTSFLFLLQLTLDARRQLEMDVAEFRVEISAKPVALRGWAVDATPQHAAQCQKARTASAPPVDV